jgi:hypothetical protein
MTSKSILLILFCSTFLFSQEEAFSNDTALDSLRLDQKYKHLLSDDLDIDLPLFFLSEIIDPYYFPFEIELLNHADGNLAYINSMTMNKIKSDINQSFVAYRKGQNKYHLGVVSDVLGYVGTAAATGLAVYHIYKYKNKYGLK